ncbi:peptide deformylase [Streptomyces sp. NPDC058892]|uniref:peptide deformylase n=1 Tax=unclassified Streptomyces TaxID=2593676 RepID=UPI00369DABC9
MPSSPFKRSAVDRSLPPEAMGGAYRPITETGDPVLHRRCADVVEFRTPYLARLLRDMYFTMHAAHGAGLAANQVGVDLRLFVYDCPDEEGTRRIGHVINPELRLAGDIWSTRGEGCLSVPGAQQELRRLTEATVHGQDWEGNAVTVHGTGLLARCLQHETDHTDGTLYLDRLGAEARTRALHQMRRNRARTVAERDERARLLATQPQTR